MSVYRDLLARARGIVNRIARGVPASLDFEDYIVELRKRYMAEVRRQDLDEETVRNLFDDIDAQEIYSNR